jgi:hypothetical protein
MGPRLFGSDFALSGVAEPELAGLPLDVFGEDCGIVGLGLILIRVVGWHVVCRWLSILPVMDRRLRVARIEYGILNVWRQIGGCAVQHRRCRCSFVAVVVPDRANATHGESLFATGW